MSFEEPVTADEKRWQAESDARTLSESKIIAADENRLSAAKTAADRLAVEERKKAEALESVGKVFKQKDSAKRLFPNTPD